MHDQTPCAPAAARGTRPSLTCSCAPTTPLSVPAFLPSSSHVPDALRVLPSLSRICSVRCTLCAARIAPRPSPPAAASSSPCATLVPTGSKPPIYLFPIVSFCRFRQRTHYLQRGVVVALPRRGYQWWCFGCGGTPSRFSSGASRAPRSPFHHRLRLLVHRPSNSRTLPTLVHCFVVSSGATARLYVVVLLTFAC